MSVMFNGILAFLCIVMLIFIIGIIFKYSLGGIRDLYFDKKTRIDEYKKGYEDGYREGLLQANKGENDERTENLSGW